MKHRIVIVAGTLLAIASFATARADVIDIVSAAGKACTYEAGSGLAGTCTTEAITPHAAWQGNNPNPPGYGGVWVSYADTGIGGDTLAPTSNLPIFSIVESFTISNAGSIDFWIWADDTADLYLNLSGAGLNLVYGANFTQSTCANGPIGCQPNEYYNLAADLAPGSYDITMSIYQVGTGTTTDSNPFGVLYSGRVSAVPEPGTLAIFGLGLLVLAVTGARSRRRAVYARH